MRHGLLLGGNLEGEQMLTPDHFQRGSQEEEQNLTPDQIALGCQSESECIGLQV